MEQGDQLSKVTLDFEINQDRLLTSENERSKLNDEKNELFTKLQNSEFQVKSLENDVEFFKNQFTFVKDQVVRNDVLFTDLVKKIQYLDADRIKLIADNKQKKENIEILDLKIIDLTSIESMLKEQNQKYESDNLKIQNMYNEMKKMDN